ncbi:MAG TPA: hypothetical protein VJ851_15095 [Jatrophihabitans sp.]|nr:hypothetical protein [Jatrophihabitans sp.]
MGERADQVADRLQQEFNLMADLVSRLSTDQVDAACGDPQGETVGHVLEHLRMGTDIVVGWLQGVVTDSPQLAAGYAHGYNHTHDHDHDHHHQDHDHGNDPHGHNYHDHDHGHSHHDPSHDRGAPSPKRGEEVAATMVALRGPGTAFVEAVRGLSDPQLDSVPPPAPSLTDGTRPLGEIAQFIANDLATHRAHLERAIAQVPQQAQ